MSNYNITTDKIILGTTYDATYSGLTESDLITQKGYLDYKSAVGSSALSSYLTTVSSSIIGTTGSSTYLLYEEKLNTIKSVADKIQEDFNDAIALSSYLSSEITRGTSTESGLSYGLVTESLRAKAGETATSVRRQTETTRALLAESVLSSSVLTPEVNRAVLAEAGLSGYNLVEMSRAMTAESLLSAGITNENTTFRTGYTAENTQKNVGDDFNTQKLQNETSLRITGDSSFLSGLSSGQQQRTASTTSEYDTMITDDTKLTNFLNTFQTNTDQQLSGLTMNNMNKYVFNSDIRVITSLYLSPNCRISATAFGTNFELYNEATSEWVNLAGSHNPVNRFTQQGSKLVGSSSIVNTLNPFVYQGFATSLAGDGKTLAIGGFGDDGGVGAVWIYKYVINSGWIEEQKIIGTGYIEKSNQGYSVSLSHDGNTVAFGGIGDNYYIGATWIWTRSGGVWTQQQKLVALSSGTNSYTLVSNEHNVKQGSSVSLSRDGNTLATGGSGDNDDTGAVWIWNRVGSSWTCTQKLIGTGSVNSNGYVLQGDAVSLSGDGLVLAVGAPYDCGGIGATWIFKKLNETWTQQTKLVGLGSLIGFTSPLILQGVSVAVSFDGSTIVVGGKGDNNGIGAFWVFYNSGNGQWNPQGGKIVPKETIGPIIGNGSSVAVSEDGSKILVGSMFNDSNKGATFYYSRDSFSKIWTQMDKLFGVGGETTVAFQGSSVSMSSNGKNIAIGGRSDNSNIGATWMYILS